MSITINGNEYRLGEWHCPHCGKRGVYEETSDGNYYVGPVLWCVHCGLSFSFQPRNVLADLKPRPPYDDASRGTWQALKRHYDQDRASKVVPAHPTTQEGAA